MIYDKELLAENNILPTYIVINDKELFEGYVRLIQHCGDSLSEMSDGDEEHLFVKERWLVEFVDVLEVPLEKDPAYEYLTQKNNKGFRTHRNFKHNVGLFSEVWKRYSGEEDKYKEQEFIDDDDYDGFF
jgi:hypothetical protein